MTQGLSAVLRPDASSAGLASVSLTSRNLRRRPAVARRSRLSGCPSPSCRDTFPDLELPDHDGVPRRLSDLVAGDPVLLHTARGHWCPKEQTFARRVLVPLQEEVEVAYARFVTVSTDPPGTTRGFRAGLGARWPFLSDEAHSYVDELGLRETTDTVHHVYAPYAFLLRPDLTVATTWVGYWYWGRPTAEEIRQGFRALTRELRRDWDV